MCKRKSFIVLGLALGVLLSCRQSYGQSTTGATAQDEFSRMDRDNKGYITRNEWNGSTQLFNRLDANRDGKLTRYEFYSRQSPLTQPLACSGEFNRMDRNSDGAIYPSEWTGMLQEFNRLDQDHSGVLSVGEFCQQDLSPNASLFRQFDYDEDGYISHDEWKRITSLSFDHLDRIHDGKLSRDEFYNRPQQPVSLFRELDLNNDGMITRSEWRGTNDAFNHLDANGDNYLSESEFYSHNGNSG